MSNVGMNQPSRDRPAGGTHGRVEDIRAARCGPKTSAAKSRLLNDVRTALRRGKGIAREVPTKGTLRLEGCA